MRVKSVLVNFNLSNATNDTGLGNEDFQNMCNDKYFSEGRVHKHGPAIIK